MAFHFAVESWAPEYGAPVAGEITGQRVQPDVRLDVEFTERNWRPLDPPVQPASEVLFVDGVQRVDARIWITGDDGVPRPGLCASFAAGAVLCDGQATVQEPRVGRSVIAELFGEAIDTGLVRYDPAPATASAVETLMHELEQQRRALEIQASQDAEAELVVLDGSLFERDRVPNAIGYLKSHEVTYVTGDAAKTIGALGAGQRTPIFLTKTSWSRYSWYLRLPCRRDHAWSGIVRCEAASTLAFSAVQRLAGLSAATLPGFASEPHKDTRAPQNLYPIAGLERDLRHRMGDQQLLYRSLRQAAALQPQVEVAATPMPFDS